MAVLHGLNLPFEIGSGYVPLMPSEWKADCQHKFVATFVFVKLFMRFLGFRSPRFLITNKSIYMFHNPLFCLYSFIVFVKMPREMEHLKISILCKVPCHGDMRI